MWGLLCLLFLNWTPKLIWVVEVDVPNLVTYLNWTPIFEWSVVWCGSKTEYCSPSLLRHVWMRKEMWYYPNVIFSIIWHFWASNVVLCIEVLQENGLFYVRCQFAYLKKAHKYEGTFVWKNYVPNILQRSPMLVQCSLRFPCIFQSTNHKWTLNYIWVPSLVHISYLYYMINRTSKRLYYKRCSHSMEINLTLENLVDG